MDPALSELQSAALPETSSGPKPELQDGFGLPLKRLAVYFLGSRLLLLLVAGLSRQVIQKGPFFRETNKVGWLNWFKCWDTGWYLEIVVNGYKYNPHGPSNIAFFPLYPLLVRLAWLVIPDVRVAGYFVSNTFLFLSCLLFWKLVRRDYGSEKLADRTVLFFLFTPVSLFFSTIYSESVFFFFVVATLYFAGGERWLLTAVCGYLAGLSRPVGVLITAMLAVTFYSEFKKKRIEWREWLPAAICTAMPGAGLATYSLFLGIKFGEPLAFEKVQIYWGHHFSFFWKYFSNLPHEPFYRVWFVGATLAAAGMLLAGVAFKLKPGHLVMGTLFVPLILSSGQMEAVPRYFSSIFPLYIAMAMLVTRWPRLEPLLFAATVSLFTLSTILFVNGYWFT